MIIAEERSGLMSGAARCRNAAARKRKLSDSITFSGTYSIHIIGLPESLKMGSSHGSSLRSAPQKTKKRASKKDQVGVFMGCFREQIRLGMLYPRELAFAKDILARYEMYGSLTGKQYAAVYKTQMRLIQERDLPS